MSDICKVCNGTGIVTRVDNYGVPDPMPSRCPACVTSTTASNTSAPTSDPEAAAEALRQAGVFKGEEGLHGLAESSVFWERQMQYGTRLYYGPNINDYLHRDVIRAAVKALAELTRLRAEVQALREDRAMLDWLESLANVKIWEELSKRWTISRDVAGMHDISADTLRDAIRAAMERSK